MSHRPTDAAAEREVLSLCRQGPSAVERAAIVPDVVAPRERWAKLAKRTLDGRRSPNRPAPKRTAPRHLARGDDQVFRVLGELKGGAMKFGQALSVFEAALPPKIAEPYRATLTRLQESAPPLPARTIHKVLAGDMGEQWRSSFAEFGDQPAAAASIGQVRRAVWHDGRQVAVKIRTRARAGR